MKHLQRIKKILLPVMSLSLLCSLSAVSTAFAAGNHVISGEWIDEIKGPGVAVWIDEEGNQTDPPTTQQEEQENQGSQTEIEQQEEIPESGEQQQEEQQQGEETQPEQTEETQPQTGEEQPAEEPQTDLPAEEEQPAAGRQIDPSKPMVALTFDDGPYAVVDNQIMDCLAQYGGKATFYVVGNRCASYPAVMQRMVAEGHEVGNHTYEHKYLNKLNTAQIRYQIDKGREAIVATTGVNPATVRLPGGNKNATVLAAVQEPILMWSVDTLDWKTRNTQSTVNAVLSKVRDGDVILMHDLYKQTGNAAVQIIPALTERGYQLVTVSELAAHRGGLAAGGVYSSFRP